MTQGHLGRRRRAAPSGQWSSGHVVGPSVRLRGRPGKGGEEGVSATFIPGDLRWELPEDWPQLCAESQEARGEEIGQRALEVPQLEHVRDVPAPFHRQDEPLGDGAPPSCAGFRTRQRVEGPVDSGRVELLGEIAELEPLWQAAGDRNRRASRDNASRSFPPVRDQDVLRASWSWKRTSHRAESPPRHASAERLSVPSRRPVPLARLRSRAPPR